MILTKKGHQAMKPLFMPVVFILCIFFVGGCSTGTVGGKKFDMSRASEIKKGVTTKTDILAMLGEPNSKSQSSYGESWNYFYSESRASSLTAFKAAWGGRAKVDMASQNLTIMFNGDVVQDYFANESKM